MFNFIYIQRRGKSVFDSYLQSGYKKNESKASTVEIPYYPAHFILCSICLESKNVLDFDAIGLANY